MKTELQIKEERRQIIEWERSNRNAATRAILGGICVYDKQVKGGCAVGRLMPDNRLEHRIAPVTALVDKDIDPILYLGIGFLQDLQGWHDTDYNFTPTGLTENGMKRLDRIESSYC